MLEWLRTKVFPEAVQAQSFGPDVKKFVSFEPDTQKEVNMQFASAITFGEIIVQKDSGELQTESVVIKTQPINYLVELLMDPDTQFHNEVLFYSKILPLLRKYDKDDILSCHFPEFIYGKATNGCNRKEDVIILKNMHKKGFKLPAEKIFLDEKHIKLALDGIAKFHALSLKCQWNEPTAFQEVVTSIKSKYKCNSEAAWEGIIKQNTFRGINALKEQEEYKDKLADICRNCENGYYWLKKYEGPSEMLSVITHGDFCRNNMMFRYDGNGDPVDVVFFDLATIKFCSPIIDTSLLLLANTAPEMRRLHSDDFLRTYYDSLAGQFDGNPATTPSETGELNRNQHLLAAGNTAKPSFDTVELEWRSKGIYGYYLASFFLPMMLAPNYKEDTMATMKEGGFSKVIERSSQVGGPRATNYVAEIVKYMIDNRYTFEH